MAIKYIPFFPEPIEGQAILDNFKRTLRYKGANEVENTLRRGMPLYEMEKQETVGENKDGNLVIRGECISACAFLREKNIKVDLVYIDPPFASGADYAKKIYIRRNPKVAEAIAKAEEQLENDDEFKKFDEKMYGDVWDKEKYLNWMYENLMAIKSVMSETASIYVHLDWHIGHYVKILLDEIFGEDNFKNEIVWGYRIQGVGKEFWARKHDNIYFYTKSDNYVFNAEKEDVIYEKPFIDTQCIAADLTQLSQKELNKIVSDLQNHKALDNKYKNVLFNKYYSNVYVRDVWDCDKTKPIISGSSEYCDYKTQKPIALLERIIGASTNKNMVVADFFGGSGVTAAAANKMGRKFVTCDIGINSIQTIRDRLKADGAEFDVLEIKDGVSFYRNPIQTMEKIKALIPGLKKEDSLDSFWEGAISDSKLGMVPVYVPNLMDGSTKLLNEMLIHRIIHEAIPALDSSVKKVIVYYIDIANLEAIKKFIREDDSTIVEIELRDLKDVLDDVVVRDEIEYTCKETDDKYLLTFEKFFSDRVSQKIDEFNQKGAANANEKKPFNPITISDDGLELIEFISVDCTASEGTWHSDYEIKIDKSGYLIFNGEKTKSFWNGTMTIEKKPLRLKVRNICGDESEFKKSDSVV